jgi:hypothetical protein
MRQTELKALLLRRRLLKVRREKGQRELINPADIWKASMEAKLEGRMPAQALWNFRRCGEEVIYATCTACGISRKFLFACNRKWCPRCQGRIAARRARAITIWARHIPQPKHLVLTKTNFAEVTAKKIRGFTKALTKLRRQKCFSPVRGGCVTVEMTNEGKGWHLHSHWLLDVQWLQMEEVRDGWAKLLDQPTAIVKIKDLREKDYAQEVAKYVAKGSEMAGWEADKLWAFIASIRGCRFFFPFGSLLKQGPEIRAEIARESRVDKSCPCGCDKIIYETEGEAVMREIREARGDWRRRRR